MGNKFGDFFTVESLNAAAEGFMKEGDKDSLIALAEENGIDREDAEDYFDGIITEFVTGNSMALGVIKKDQASCDKNTIYAMLFQTLIGMLPDAALSAGIIQKRSMKDLYMLFSDYARKYGNGIGGTNKQLENIIREYYTAGDGKSAAGEIIKRMCEGRM